MNSSEWLSCTIIIYIYIYIYTYTHTHTHFLVIRVRVPIFVYMANWSVLFTSFIFMENVNLITNQILKLEVNTKCGIERKD